MAEVTHTSTGSLEAWAQALSDAHLIAAQNEFLRRPGVPIAVPDAEDRHVAEAYGWRCGGDNNDVIYDSKVFDSWKEAVSWSGDADCGDEAMQGSPVYSSWRDCCEGEGFLSRRTLER